MENNMNEKETITIKFKIGESERLCSVKKQETIKILKQRQFPAENVRFIYQGRELDDGKTIKELKFLENAVIHVAFRRTNADTSSNRTSTRSSSSHGLFPEPEMDPCVLLAIFLGLTIILGVMLATSLPELLNTFSWIVLAAYSLGGISFISVIVKSRLNNERMQRRN
jgi:hypothetical protein